MSQQLDWHGDEAARMVRAKAVRVLYRAAYTVQRIAKQLLSVAGTGVAQPKAKKGGGGDRASNRQFVNEWNERHKLAIAMKSKDFKRLRLTKAGGITDRRKAGKVYYKNVNGKMVRRRRK